MHENRVKDWRLKFQHLSKKSNLPCGVHHNPFSTFRKNGKTYRVVRKKPYYVSIWMDGRLRYVGAYATVPEAQTAYLNAVKRSLA